MEEVKNEFKPFGLKWWLCGVLIVVIIAAAVTGALTTDLAGAFALMLAIGIICNEIGERIPIWNDYIGGGLVLTFLASAVLFTYNIIPKKYATSIGSIVMGNKVDFLTLFIIFLITGSILALNRKLLIRSFAGYIPAIFGGLIGAAGLGILGGFVFGISPQLIILNYVLPIMGGGNGAGAVPLSQIYETVTGDKAAHYYTFAITILTIANIFAIITAALLHKVGKMKPSWTGDGSTLMKKDFEEETADKAVTPSLTDLGGAFFLTLGLYALGRLFAKSILPTIFGVAIHPFAYMIVFVALVAASGVVPESTKAAAKRLQAFMTTNMILIIMVGVGVDTDINELLAAINLENVVIALLIVLGAIFGSAIVGKWVGFYPIDTAITAGLCMANRGGSGDLAVLGASKRMGLIAYAQLSSRLGGGIVLIIGSIMFGALIGGK